MVRKTLISGLLSLVFVTCLTGVPQRVSAAEVRGTVTVEYQGMFTAGADVQAQPVSVALLPAEEQYVVPRRSRLYQVEIVGNRMSPAFFTVKKGDSIRFVNRDGVYHQIFSLSSGKPWSARLDQANRSRASSPKLVLDVPGTTHFFCRIHSKSYARIDVVDTPYLETVKSGRDFHFVGLAGGRWKLRLASPAAETRWVEVRAMTSPPPLALRLVSRGGGQGRGQLNAQTGVEQLYRD
jgi:plastocyanin